MVQLLIDNRLLLGIIGLGAGLVVGAHAAVDLTSGQAAGLFSGSLTNTPAASAS